MDLDAREPLDTALLRDLLCEPDGPLSRLLVVDRTESTNAQLVAEVAADPEAWRPPALLVAEHQVAGRGRAGRTWQTPPRAALTASLVVRPQVPRDRLGWLPLLAGLATVTALRSTLGVQAVAKWPNDVLAATQEPELAGWGRLRKIAGILVEVVPDGVVVGVGLNVSQTPEELPVPTAVSVAQAGGASVDRTVILTALAESFVSVLGRWTDAGGDVVESGLADEVAAVSATIGATVRVELTGGGELVGVATGLAPDGALVVEDSSGALVTVHSGDVYHLRLN